MAFAVAILLVAAAYIAVQARLVTRFADFVTQQSLRGQSNDIAEAIELNAADGSVRVRLGLQDAYGFDAFFANLKYRVLTIDGTVAASSDGRLDSLLPDLRADSQDGVYRRTVIDDVSFHVAAVRHVVQGRPFVIQMGRSDRFATLAQEAISPAVAEAVGLVAGVSTLVLAVLSYLGVRSVLRPIRRVSEAAGSVGGSNLSARLPVDDVPSEIRPLVIAFNDVLERLESAFLSQQRFFADAAHELKTPIALLRAQLEAGPQPASQAILQDVDALGRTVNQLLHIAEVSGGRPLDLRPVAVEEVARQVTRFLCWQAERADVSLQVTTPQGGVSLSADPGELFVLIKNLTENAIAHSPGGAVVLLEITPDRLDVVDQGPGVPLTHRADVFERFWRSPDNTRPGSGLGLSICLAIARSHGWRIECLAAETGSALFRVSWRG